MTQFKLKTGVEYAVTILPDKLLITEKEANTPSQSDLTAENNYKLGVLDCHQVLDDLGIPTAKGQSCSDPSCKSPVGHRLRHLRTLYQDLDLRMHCVSATIDSQLSDHEKIAELTKIMTDQGKEH